MRSSHVGQLGAGCGRPRPPARRQGASGRGQFCRASIRNCRAQGRQTGSRGCLGISRRTIVARGGSAAMAMPNSAIRPNVVGTQVRERRHGIPAAFAEEIRAESTRAAAIRTVTASPEGAPPAPDRSAGFGRRSWRWVECAEIRRGVRAAARVSTAGSRHQQFGMGRRQPGAGKPASATVRPAARSRFEGPGSSVRSSPDDRAGRKLLERAGERKPGPAASPRADDWRRRVPRCS